MKTTLIDLKRQHWRGSLQAFCEVAKGMVTALEDRGSTDVRCSVRAFTARGETEYDSLEEFRAGKEFSEPGTLTRLILTTDNFARERPVAAELVVSKVPNEPAVYCKVRGHDPDKTKGVLATVVEVIDKVEGKRFPTDWIPNAILFLFVGGQLVFFTFGLPNWSGRQFYVLLFLVTVVPAVCLALAPALNRRFNPKVEFTGEPTSASPAKARFKASALLSGVGIFILAPIAVTYITHRMGLN